MKLYFFFKKCAPLYTSDTWVIANAILRSLEAFHHKVAHCRIRPCPGTDNDWIRTNFALFPTTEYLVRRPRYIQPFVDLPLSNAVLSGAVLALLIVVSGGLWFIPI